MVGCGEVCMTLMGGEREKTKFIANETIQRGAREARGVRKQEWKGRAAVLVFGAREERPRGAS